MPRAVGHTPMTVVAVLDGPSVASLPQTAARKLTRAEKHTVKAQRIAEQAAPRAAIATGSRSGSLAATSTRCAGSPAWLMSGV